MMWDSNLHYMVAYFTGNITVYDGAYSYYYFKTSYTRYFTIAAYYKYSAAIYSYTGPKYYQLIHYAYYAA